MKDIYATLNEPYITKNELPDQPDQQSHSNNDHETQEKDVIAAMYQLQKEDSKSPSASASAIHFRDAHCVWQAITNPAGPTPNYRFAIKNEYDQTSAEQSRILMQWEKRSSNSDSDECFVLLAIDRKARRKSRIASMNRGGFEINVRKSSILEHLRTCMALTDPVSGGDSDGDLELWLYTHVLTLGVWVASQEGWLN
jgi:hypothetical protein